MLKTSGKNVQSKTVRFLSKSLKFLFDFRNTNVYISSVMENYIQICITIYITLKSFCANIVKLLIPIKNLFRRKICFNVFWKTYLYDFLIRKKKRRFITDFSSQSVNN